MQFRGDMYKMFWTIYIQLAYIVECVIVPLSIYFMYLCWTEEVKVLSTSPKNTRYKILVTFFWCRFIFVTPDFEIFLSRLGFEHPTFCLRGECSQPLRHRHGGGGCRWKVASRSPPGNVPWFFFSKKSEKLF